MVSAIGEINRIRDALNSHADILESFFIANRWTYHIDVQVLFMFQVTGISPAGDPHKAHVDKFAEILGKKLAADFPAGLAGSKTRGSDFFEVSALVAKCKPGKAMELSYSDEKTIHFGIANKRFLKDAYDGLSEIGEPDLPPKLVATNPNYSYKISFYIRWAFVAKAAPPESAG